MHKDIIYMLVISLKKSLIEYMIVALQVLVFVLCLGKEIIWKKNACFSLNHGAK
jgi:hypothetical protein